MKYVINLRDDGTISRLGTVKPEYKYFSKKSKTTKYSISENDIEITKDKYLELVNIKGLNRCKYINGEIIHEPEEEKQARLKLLKENRLKLESENKKKQAKEMLSLLSEYVNLNKKGKELLNE